RQRSDRVPRPRQTRRRPHENADRAVSNRVLPRRRPPACRRGRLEPITEESKMDDLTFSARRASAAAPARTAEPTDLETRFRTLVQSPLRAGLLRYLGAGPDDSFADESLMPAFGRLP